MTNLEHLIQQQTDNLKAFAEKRIIFAFCKYPATYGWKGDFDGMEESKTKAIEKEITWLTEEKKND